MRTEIYIEDNRLDLYKDISAEFTYNIDDVKDFSARNTNFSKTILIPGNATNNKLFGHVFEFGSGNFYDSTGDNVGYNFNAAKSAACVIYVDKIQLFKGVLRLLEIVIDNGSIEYECAVFGELGGFVSALGIKKIEELDFSAYDHVWNKDSIINSWDQASGTTASGMGYFYPLIDYGQVSSNKKDYKIGAFRPALFVREYMTKIIAAAGYTYESSFFDSAVFKRLVVPNNQKFLSTTSTLAFKAEDSLMSYIFSTASGNTSIGYIATKLGQFTYLGSYQYQFTGASLNATLSVICSGSTIVPTGQSGTVEVGWYKNGVLQTKTLLGVNRGNFDKRIDFNIALVTNDTLELRLIYSGVTSTMSVDFLTNTTEINTATAVAVPLNSGETVIINETIPKGVFQKDFFASIVKMFNLYVTESTDKTKHLIITPYIDYYTGQAHFLQVNDLEEELKIDDNFLLLLDDANADYLDWSKKVDRSKAFRLKPMSELNGRYFEYKYKVDSDYYNDEYNKKYAQGYADFIEDTGYEFAQDKQTAEVVFSSTPLIGYTGEDKIVSVIYKRSNTQNTGSEDQMDSIIRIFQVRKITGMSNWHIKNEAGSNVSGNLNAYGYGGHLDDPITPTADINFGAPKEINFTLNTTYPSANLFNAFWSDYVAEISDKDSKLLSCYVHLTDQDIYSLDFAKLIWIDGALWRLNKVEDYNPITSDTTKCEFLKVIELTYE